jgi:hypothetical protein
MRRITASLIYRCIRNSNLGAVQLLLGHTKPEGAVQYLGIELDDALEICTITQTKWTLIPISACASPRFRGILTKRHIPPW